MNNVEKHEAVREHLGQYPEQSDRQIASLLDVSPTFVGKVRRYLEGKGKLAHVEKRQGQDGRKRARRRSAEEIKQARISEARERGKRLVAEIDETFLRQQRKKLAEIEIKMGFYRNNNEPLAQKWLAELEEQRKEILERIAFVEEKKWRG